MSALDIRDADLIDKAYLELLAERAGSGASIALERADQPEALALIEELDAYQMPLYPAESHHGVEVSVLLQPNVAFAVARDESGQAVGCGAVWCVPEYGELKRMYVRPQCRGKGVARALMDFLEDQAKARGCAAMTLETGIHQHEAIALYRRAGYEFCAPFGSYAVDPNSVFMRKPF
ncbi:GNAT family N-acetyltransferase [Chromobacterium alticapitis]|uniref:GNAT family N-acetyltransferase n=2 Tax=Chromobacterium alticapitis TaxID=2073169 RepID=A0A2S5DKI2_9NEIS|nr:GNAT family N-acetyltransferase [Chromobacterium alticapitis]